MALNTAKLADGDSSSETDSTGVLPTMMPTHPCPHFNLYRTLGTSAMAHGGSAMAHGGAPVKYGAQCPVKMLVGLLGSRQTYLCYRYRLR